MVLVHLCANASLIMEKDQESDYKSQRYLLQICTKLPLSLLHFTDLAFNQWSKDMFHIDTLFFLLLSICGRFTYAFTSPQSSTYSKLCIHYLKIHQTSTNYTCGTVAASTNSLFTLHTQKHSGPDWISSAASVNAHKTFHLEQFDIKWFQVKEVVQTGPEQFHSLV